MSKVIAVEDPKQHRVCLQSDKAEIGEGQLILVRGGPGRAYLWIGNDKGCLMSFSGEKALRSLAKAILAEIAKS